MLSPARDHAQSVHSPIGAHARAQSVPSPYLVCAQCVPRFRPCPCPIRVQPAPSQALSQTDRPSELMYMILYFQDIASHGKAAS
jgi:hypothetical protein